MKRGPPNSPILYKHCPRPSYLSPHHLHSQRQSLISNLSLLSNISPLSDFAYHLTSQTKSYRTLNIQPRCNSSPLSLCSPSPLLLPPLRSNLLPWISSRALILHLVLPLGKLAQTVNLFFQNALPSVSLLPPPLIMGASSLSSNLRLLPGSQFNVLVSRSSTCTFYALLKQLQSMESTFWTSAVLAVTMLGMVLRT